MLFTSLDEFFYNRRKVIKEDWIGFLHNPPNVPPFVLSAMRPADTFSNIYFIKSLKFCKGVFVFSNYLRDHLLDEIQVNVPVCSLIHPTKGDVKFFSFSDYKLNKKKLILHIGYWLRNFSVFDSLISTNHIKVVLKIDNKSFYRFERQRCLENNFNIINKSISIFHLDEILYDDILSKNVVFIYLYDSSVNNVILECIQRETPIFVNPLPAVKEYLGDEYPLYYHNVSEVTIMLNNIDLIYAAHNYLKHRKSFLKLSKNAFLKQFINSEIYKKL